MGHTQRHAYIFSLTLIFHTTISLHAWYLTSRRKSLCFYTQTYSYFYQVNFSKKILYTNDQLTKANCAGNISWITICHAVFELRIGDFSRSGTVSPESKSYTSLKNVKCTIKYEVTQVALHKEDLLFCKVFKSLSRLEA